MSYSFRRPAIPEWSTSDELADALRYELTEIGLETLGFAYDQSLPKEADLVFSFGPLGRLLPLLAQKEALPDGRGPIFIHWNTEGLPDIRWPWLITESVSRARSWFGRHFDSPGYFASRLAARGTGSWSNGRLHRFRYIGDYRYAYKKGWLDLLVTSSAVYTQLLNEHHLSASYAPFGASPVWSDDLALERDIDVLWLGKRGTRRRSRILDQVRRQLQAHNIHLHMVDNEENPFVFGEARTQLLNRAKITLNVCRTWYDENLLRFMLAAPNRSLFVSEALLPHCPPLQPGNHYASAPAAELAETILFYLDHEPERQRIVDEAYDLTTTRLTLANSVRSILAAAERRATATAAAGLLF